MDVVAHSFAPGLGDRIIKVNHAGEHGAIAIYTGQILLARLTAPALVDELREFRSHEERHRAIFGAELVRRGRPRCRSYWFCGLGGVHPRRHHRPAGTRGHFGDHDGRRACRAAPP